MAGSNKPIKLLKGLIWTYLILLLTEGAMRKWILPGLSDYLLIVRDPVVILIYFAAIAAGRFEFNGFVAGGFLLAVATFCASFLLPDTNMIVSAIGVRCYFLHLPLIFVMERTLTKEDIWRMGKFLLWFAIPETFLVVAQLSSPQTAWVNLGLRGQVTEGFAGALDKLRPSGTFSFTTGVGSFYPLVLAALLGLLFTRKKIPLYLTVATAVSILFGVYCSLNRTNALTCTGVLLAGGTAIFALPKAPKQLLRLVLLVGVATLIASFLPHFDEGIESFNARWVGATGSDLNGFQSNIVKRFFNDLLPSAGVLTDMPVLGYGVGMGVPMAQAYLTGSAQFNFGETEWPRVILEMGPVLGVAFILLRIGLCARLIQASIVSLRRENIWPLLFSIGALFLVFSSSWGQPTILGFAMFTSGLVLAASRMDLTQSKATTRPRRSAVRKFSPPDLYTPKPPLPGQTRDNFS